MLEGERSYQRGQENLVPSNNASSVPESPVIPKNQENPWYIRHFTKLLLGFGLGGGAVAILLPLLLWLHCGMSSGSSDQLRLHLLYVTGGIIAVLTLLQTNWKNQGDRLKIDADIKKNEQDAEKNERDHIRQVHAERRSRYTKAVEQLANEKASVRLGGIYTLVGLVDEWLTDGTLIPEERQKEGQVIINNLCSYIRSPFPLIDKQYTIEKNTLKEKNAENHPNSFLSDRTKIQEEQEVRRTIFAEISKRVSTFDKFDGNKIVHGTWSNFEFNFVKSYIFYSLSNLNLENPNFSQATFLEESDFIGTIFLGKANFSEANFSHQAHFSWTRFMHTADFHGTNFALKADFRNATFTQIAYFSEATFAHVADFRWVDFPSNLHFDGARFVGDAHFDWATFNRSYFGKAQFVQKAYFTGATFAQNTDFYKASFAQKVIFSGATFTQNTDFSGASFTQRADFSKATFDAGTDFIGAIFMRNVDFCDASFTKIPPFFTIKHKESNEMYSTRFATLPVASEAHNFTVHEDSQPILLGTTELNGAGYRIPVGTILFDSDSWDEDKQDYTRISEPAK
jgi:hypothetical protein